MSNRSLTNYPRFSQEYRIHRTLSPRRDSFSSWPHSHSCEIFVLCTAVADPVFREPASGVISTVSTPNGDQSNFPKSRRRRLPRSSIISVVVVVASYDQYPSLSRSQHSWVRVAANFSVRIRTRWWCAHSLCIILIPLLAIRELADHFGGTEKHSVDDLLAQFVDSTWKKDNLVALWGSTVYCVVYCDRYILCQYGKYAPFRL